jgi:mevalonate kinase
MSLTTKNSYESRAKLMVSGEYFVLQGALSLALPLKYGQSLTIDSMEGKSLIYWKSSIHNDVWFTATLRVTDFRVLESNSPAISSRISDILAAARTLHPNFLGTGMEYHIHSSMDFLPDWGMGSSSTLISNVAYWASCDPFELNRRIFQGSGYDIACARSASPIVYELKNGESTYRNANFYPLFGQQLYFVYLNRKQNSQKSISNLETTRISSKDTAEISSLTIGMELAQDLATFRLLMDLHEELVGKTIRKIPVKQLYFDDFNGSIKSLGAWGGDFVLAASPASEAYVRNYFQGKGLQTIFPYREVVLTARSGQPETR